jgi:hypothetical protein
LRDSLESTPPAMSEKEMRVCGYSMIPNGANFVLYCGIIVAERCVCIIYLTHLSVTTHRRHCQRLKIKTLRITPVYNKTTFCSYCIHVIP